MSPVRGVGQAGDLAKALAIALPFQPAQSIKQTILFLESATTTMLISDGLADYRLSRRSPLSHLVDDLGDFTVRGLFREG